MTSTLPFIKATRRGPAASDQATPRACGAALALLGLLLGGCGGGKSTPETAPVTGVVKVDGKPLTTGTIMFTPASGRAALGTINPDGSYRLTTFAKDDGALLGKHTVTIEASEVIGGKTPTSLEEELKGVKPGVLKLLVPPRYGDRATTDQTAEVKAGENRLDFQLLSK